MAKQSSVRRKPPSAKGGGGGGATQAKPGAAPQRATQAQAARTSSAKAKGSVGGESARYSSMHERVAERRTVNQRRRYEQRPWWQGRTLVFGTIIVVALVVVIFVAIAHNQNQTTAVGIGQPVPVNVMQQVTQVSPTVFTSVGTGGMSATFKPLQPPPSSPLKGSNGNPEVLYIGAEWCPYCAAQRLSMVVALSRFGTFSNLHLMVSSSTDAAGPNTHTFTFYKSSYTSKYVQFVPVENEARDQSVQQDTTKEQLQLWTTYTGNPPSYPFIDIANQYMNVGSGFDPMTLQGLDWQQIASKLSNPNDPVTKGIVGNANYMTAAICKATNNQPANVCTAAPIPQIEQQLPKGS